MHSVPLSLSIHDTQYFMEVFTIFQTSSVETPEAARLFSNDKMLPRIMKRVQTSCVEMSILCILNSLLEKPGSWRCLTSCCKLKSLQHLSNKCTGPVLSLSFWDITSLDCILVQSSASPLKVLAAIAWRKLNLQEYPQKSRIRTFLLCLTLLGCARNITKQSWCGFCTLCLWILVRTGLQVTKSAWYRHSKDSLVLRWVGQTSLQMEGSYELSELISL